MKVLIVSDTHGKHDTIAEVLRREKPLDMLIHLGDAEGYEDYIQSMADCPIEVVKGNSDRKTEIPRDRDILVDNMKIMITHGHCYGVNTTLERLYMEALKRGADVAMYGHTHMPLIIEDRTMTILNPGSLSFPRQENGQPSYIVMTKEKGAKASFELKYL